MDRSRLIHELLLPVDTHPWIKKIFGIMNNLCRSNILISYSYKEEIKNGY